MKDNLIREFCRNCGMELEFSKYDFERATMNDGTPVKIKCFTCLKCDEKFIVSVYDEESNRLRATCNNLQDKLNSLYSCRPRNCEEIASCRVELEANRELMYQHDKKLKHKFLKEMRRHG